MTKKGRYKLKKFNQLDFIEAGETNAITFRTNLQLLRPFSDLKKRRHGEFWIADL